MIEPDGYPVVSYSSHYGTVIVNPMAVRDLEVLVEICNGQIAEGFLLCRKIDRDKVRCLLYIIIVRGKKVGSEK